MIFHVFKTFLDRQRLLERTEVAMISFADAVFKVLLETYFCRKYQEQVELIYMLQERLN